MKNFLSTQDWSLSDLNEILDMASLFKKAPIQNHLKGKSVALLFLNPSLRTRASFEIGISELGGTAIILQPGKDAWAIELEPGTLMEGGAEEHIIEVAGVLSRYADMIGIRAFPAMKNWQEDRQDFTIKELARHASVPVVNMETILHPCQEMALALTIKEHLGGLKGKKFLLTWVPHPRALNTAVANSALLIATRFGADVTLLCPHPDYILDEHFMETARGNAKTSGGSVRISHDIKKSYDGANFVYAKSWGALPYYGRPGEEQTLREQFHHFIVDQEKMGLTDNALFSHCLPLRRNVKATDAVMDSKACVAIDEAENRLHTQKAIMLKCLDMNLEDMQNEC